MSDPNTNDNELVKTIVSVGFAALLVIVTAVNPFGSGPPPADIARTGRLFEDFNDLGQAATLEVFDWDEEVAESSAFKIAFKDGTWQIPSKDGYPADAKEKLGKVAAVLMNMERQQLRSSREQDHELLGVVNPKASPTDKPTKGRGRRVRMSDSGGKVLADVIIGKEVEGSDGLRYVRVMTSDTEGETEVYAAKANFDLSTKFLDWIHTDLLELDVAQITSLTIDRSRVEQFVTQDGRRGAQLVRGEVSDISQVNHKWSVKGTPEGHEANMETIDAITEVLKELTIKNVFRREEAPLSEAGFFPQEGGEYYSGEGEIAIELKNGLRTVLRFGEPAPNLDGDPLRFMIVGSELSKASASFSADKLKEAKEALERQKARFDGWYYLISASDFGKLRPASKALTKEKSEPEDDGHEGHDHEGEPHVEPQMDPLSKPNPFPPVPPFEDKNPQDGKAPEAPEAPEKAPEKAPEEAPEKAPEKEPAPEPEKEPEPEKAPAPEPEKEPAPEPDPPK